MKEALHNKLPIPSEDLKQFNRNVKEQALGLFAKKSIGEFEDFKSELLKRIRVRFASVKAENEREGARVCT